MNAIAVPTAPHNLHAERSVLGAVLMRNDAWTDVRDAVGPDDFYRAAHAMVFRRMDGLAQVGRAIDPLTLSDLLARHGELDEVGGPSFLMGLTDGVPRSTNAVHYAEMVRDYSRRRQCIAVAQLLLEQAQSDDDVNETIAKSERALRDIEAGRATELTSIADAVNAGLDHLEATAQADFGVTGIPSGFFSLDRMLGGFQREDLIVVGARPSVGKTAFMGQVAANAARDGGVPTVVVTLETRASQLALRMASAKAQVDLIAIREKRASDGELTRLNVALEALHRAPITFLDTREVRMSDIRRHARRLHAQGKCDLLLLDYLTLVNPEKSATRGENREQQVAAQSKLAKSIARELAIPVVILCQLSRDFERDGAQKPGGKPKTARRPRLSDLRESGAIEQDADVVLFVHRPFVRPNTIEERMREGETELIVAKQRNGPIGQIRAHFTKEFVRFDEREGE